MWKTGIGALCGVLALSVPASAANPCDQRSALVERLQDGYAERPVAFGLASNGAIMEVLVSRYGTWSILATKADGTTCIIASGEAWEDIGESLSAAADDSRT